MLLKHFHRVLLMAFQPQTNVMRLKNHGLLPRMVMKRLLQYLLFAKAPLYQCLLDGPFKILTDQDMICPNLSNLGYGLPFFCNIVATSGYENSNSSFSYSFMLSLLDS